jgi:DNA mismatch repair protein MutS2
MNYPENIGEKLGFNQIQNHIKSLCLSNMGAEYADKMKFSRKVSFFGWGFWDVCDIYK